LKSGPLQEWIKAQDAVFGMGGSGATSVPPPAAATAAALAKADRAYQIAAATFYKKDYSKAGQLFEQISRDDKSPWKTLASYMVARCKANGDAPSEEKVAFLESRIKEERDPGTKADLYDLLKPITYEGMTNADLLGRLVASVTSKHSDRFGGDVGDLTF